MDHDRRDDSPRTDSVQAALLATSLSESSGLLGAYPELLPPAAPAPVIRVVEWPWIRPLQVIFQLTGWTADDVVSNPAAAAEVRRMWKLWKHSRRLAEAPRRR